MATIAELASALNISRTAVRAAAGLPGNVRNDTQLDATQEAAVRAAHPATGTTATVRPVANRRARATNQPGRVRRAYNRVRETTGNGWGWIKTRRWWILLLVLAAILLWWIWNPLSAGYRSFVGARPGIAAVVTDTPEPTDLPTQDPTQPVIAALPTETPEPTEPAPTAKPFVAADGREFEMTIAGADFFALGVEELGEGWMRVREAGNRDYCAWSNQFKMEISSGVAAQIPHCLEWRITGTGSLVVTFKPDETGYATSDTLGTGLAWWPAGNNGSYRVTRDGKTTEWIPLTTGPEGVNFPLDGSEVTIEFTLENGFVAMPLGEIRNNVQPQY